MKSSLVLTSALSLLVVASLGAWGVRTWRESRAAAAGTAPAETAVLLADGVNVINFHGALRCPTCLHIGALSQAVIDEEFADANREGRVAWLSVDFDRPENVHFKADYELVSSNVVVVRRAAGKDVAWSRLDDVWSLHGDEPAFRAYVHEAVDAALTAR